MDFFLFCINWDIHVLFKPFLYISNWVGCLKDWGMAHAMRYLRIHKCKMELQFKVFINEYKRIFDSIIFMKYYSRRVGSCDSYLNILFWAKHIYIDFSISCYKIYQNPATKYQNQQKGSDIVMWVNVLFTFKCVYWSKENYSALQQKNTPIILLRLCTGLLAVFRCTMQQKKKPFKLHGLISIYLVFTDL